MVLHSKFITVFVPHLPPAWGICKQVVKKANLSQQVSQAFCDASQPI